MVDPRDVARIRTEARLAELAALGLLALVTPETPEERELRVALNTAREFLYRAQDALTAAMEKLPGYRA